MRLVFCVLAVVALAGCASTASGTDSELSLALTKSPVQLLRNEAASRVSDVAGASVRDTDDFSVSCRSADDDPSGLIRQWQSTATIELADDAIDTARDLAASFTDEDWTSRSITDDAASFRVLLTKPSTTASIHIESDASTIEIWTNGPCVDTEGAESDEVTSLE